MNEMPTPDPKPASSAYTGHVVHARRRPRAHRLRYRVFYLLLDLAELPRLDRDLRLFGFNRAGLFSFHERDHGPRDGTSLRRWVDAQLAEAGIEIPGGRVSLLCLPRILGYVFNPISVFFVLIATDIFGQPSMRSPTPSGKPTPIFCRSITMSER